MEAAAAANTAGRDGASRYHSVAHSRAINAAAKIGSVMGVVARYSMLGLSANNAAAVNPAAGPQHLRAAANRNVPASPKHAHDGIAPGQPARPAAMPWTKRTI